MFTQNQINYIQYQVQQMYNNGYKYYVVHSNTRMNGESSYNFHDLTFYFSKTEIKNNILAFSVPSNSIKIDVITQNANERYQDNRIITNNITNAITVNVKGYEFIMTNCNNSNYMNIIADNQYKYTNALNYNYNILYGISCILAITFLYTYFKNIYKRRASNK